MLTIKNWDLLSKAQQKELLTRNEGDFNAANVLEIVESVRINGDKALVQFSQQFDGLDLNCFKLSEEEWAEAKIKDVVLDAINKAISTIKTYHFAAKPKDYEINTAKGISIKRVFKPINKVGFYVPGGNNTPLISSLLMQAVPAKIANNPLRVLCTPVNQQGKISPELIVAAKLCGVSEIYKLGGAQAIAAMAYGTETIPKVDKIFGPGNRYVTEAKKLVSKDGEGAAIDMPAGPSEVMIFADNFANPDFVAADLLAQAEHGEDSQVFLLCENLSFAELVNKELIRQIAKLKRRNTIKKSFEKSAIILVNSKQIALDIINDYAPEHLILNCLEAENWLAGISNAGTIFIGPWASETLGDYISGSNHILPTNGYAKNYSGLSTSDFFKAISYQHIDEQGVKNLGKEAHLLAMLEGLDGHANAVKQRLDFLSNSAPCQS